MKQWIYRILVNRVPGIRDRYLHFRQQHGERWTALLYLLWLNIQYYLFFCRSLGKPQRFPMYEEKTLYSEGSESSLSARESPEAFAAKLAAYDVISFDVFDTLLFPSVFPPHGRFFAGGNGAAVPGFQTHSYRNRGAG